MSAWRSTGIALIALLAAPRQPAGAQPLPPLPQYDVRVFTAADGLHQADVRGVAHAPDGYLYVAGGRGLLRFDGERFEPVPLDGSSTRFIESMELDGQGRLWLIFRGETAGYYDRRGFHSLAGYGRVSGPPGLAADGVVWLATEAGLLRLGSDADAAPELLQPAAGAPATRLRLVSAGPEGGLLVRTPTDLRRLVAHQDEYRLVELGLSCATLSHYPTGNNIWIACQQADGSVRYLRYRAGLLIEQTQNGPAPDPARLSAEELAGRTWLASLSSSAVADPLPLPLDLSRRVLVRSFVLPDSTHWLVLRQEQSDTVVRIRSGTPEIITLPAGLGPLTIQAIAGDHEGSIWFGTSRGLIQLTKRRVQALTQAEGLTEAFVTAVRQTRDGSVWVGTFGGGLNRYAGGRLAHRYTTADGLLDDRVRSLYEDFDGTLWIGTNHGFAALRHGRVTRTVRHAETRAFARTPDGRLWVATTTGLLYDTGTGFERHSSGYWPHLWTLHVDRAGALWIGGENGLHRLAGDTLQRFTAADGLRSDFVVAVHEEPDGTLWLSTYEHGLHRYRNGRFVAVTAREGLHHDGVWGMLHDDTGYIWMSSDFGLFRVERRRLHAIADALERGELPTQRLAPLVFTEAHGMPGRESNRAFPAGWRLADGRLLFNAMGGVAVIEPQHAVAAVPEPPVVVRNVTADGLPLAADAPVARVPVGTRHLAFDFAALTFLAPQQTRYRYRLLGFDTTWVDNGTLRHAIFSALRPGRYTLQVQSRNGAGAWTDPGAAYAFVVPPRLWQMWWFRALMAAAIGALLTVLYQYRVRRLLELERLRLRIAADLHDDVGSNLSSIALLSEMLRDRMQTDAIEQRQLKRIGTAAEQTIGALRDIIWLVDPKHGSLDDLITRMRALPADLLLNGTAWTFHANVQPRGRPLGMAFMRCVLLVYKEALHNVVRHAHATRLAIAVETVGTELCFTIEDDGIGFDTAARGTGRGLENMKRRAAEAGGRLDIVSGPGIGTRIRFRGPLA